MRVQLNAHKINGEEGRGGVKAAAGLCLCEVLPVRLWSLSQLRLYAPARKHDSEVQSEWRIVSVKKYGMTSLASQPSNLPVW